MLFLQKKKGRSRSGAGSSSVSEETKKRNKRKKREDEAEAQEMSLEDELREATDGSFIENRPPVYANTNPDLIMGILSDDKLVTVLPDVSANSQEDFSAEEMDVEIVEVFGSIEKPSTSSTLQDQSNPVVGSAEKSSLSQAHSLDFLSGQKGSSNSSPSKTPKGGSKHTSIAARKSEPLAVLKQEAKSSDGKKSKHSKEDGSLRKEKTK